jgi:Short repeat of unknown function (DUF308)
MKILMVLTSHDQLGHTGRKTGFWLEEFAAPYYVFKDAGATITLASPRGGKPPIDPRSEEPAAQTTATVRFRYDIPAQRVLSGTERGVVDLIAGAIAFVWPLITVLAFVSIMGAWAIVSGALLLAAAFRLDRTYGRWQMGFGGLVSLIWGVLLIAWPLIGAVVLTWWMGAYALLFGGALIALAFSLRKRRELPPSGALPQGT